MGSADDREMSEVGFEGFEDGCVVGGACLSPVVDFNGYDEGLGRVGR